MNVCDECKARGPHYKCQLCGMHNLVDNKPCVRCTHFRFDAIEADAQATPNVDVAPIQSETKRRPRGRSAVTT